MMKAIIIESIFNTNNLISSPSLVPCLIFGKKVRVSVAFNIKKKLRKLIKFLIKFSKDGKCFLRSKN